MNKSIRSSSGFTLVELLVILGVVLTLCAMTLGVLTQLKSSSQNSKCLANLRSTGAAALAFFHDRNGQFFPNKFWYSRASWDADPGMRDYLGITSRDKVNSSVYLVDSVLTCPTLKESNPVKFPNFLNRCYTMNHYLQMKDPSSSFNGNEAARPALAGGAGRLANVPKLSAMWMFTDGSAASSGSGEFHTAAKRSYESLYMSYPHNGYQNVVFADGHVARLTKDEFENPASVREFWGDLSSAD